jgi:hypothetical protein
MQAREKERKRKRESANYSVNCFPFHCQEKKMRKSIEGVGADARSQPTQRGNGEQNQSFIFSSLTDQLLYVIHCLHRH